jgi:hypothetical protein
MRYTAATLPQAALFMQGDSKYLHVVPAVDYAQTFTPGAGNWFMGQPVDAQR